MAKTSEDIVNTFKEAAENVESFKKMFDRLKGIENRVQEVIDSLEFDLKMITKIKSMDSVKGAAYTILAQAEKDTAAELEKMRALLR